MSEERQMCGGFRPGASEATPEEQAILDTVKPHIESHLGRSVNALSAVHFTTQVVAGTIYVMSAKADDDFIHVKIIKPLPHTGKGPELMQLKTDVSHETPLVPF